VCDAVSDVCDAASDVSDAVSDASDVLSETSGKALETSDDFSSLSTRVFPKPRIEILGWRPLSLRDGWQVLLTAVF
jgi:hypothetical protein